MSLIVYIGATNGLQFSLKLLNTAFFGAISGLLVNLKIMNY
jgi:hypothetical protein